MEFKDLLSYKALKKLDTNLSSQVDTVYKMVKETINGISGCFDNYTMHDIGHSVRVAHYMEQLAFGIDDNQEKRLKEFNAVELTILLLSALLHDIGMFIRPIDRQEIKNNTIKYADKLKITYNGVLEVKKGNEDEAVKEIIRLTHAARIFEFLEYEFDERQTIAQILKINDNYDYANDIGQVCQAHGEDYNFIKTLRTSITKGIYEYNLQYFAVLLRIADYLDLDKQRTPILWFSMMGINGFSKSEWETHFQISNEKKLKQCDENKMQIYFDGISSDARIHRKYLKYIDNLREEIENADILLNNHNVKPKYRLNIITRIDNLVQTKGFEYSDLRLSLDYAAITDLLMGKNIYGDNKLGLRELIQNAIDACKLIQEIDSESDERPETKILISISQHSNYVKIRDTGIGMTLDIIKNHFLNIGKSYYKSNEYLYNNYNYKPIGQYGIGFLACFLLSDNVVVKTKYYDSNNIYQIELEKHSEYVVTNTEHSTMFTGTEIKLEYNQFFSIFKSIDELKEFIETYFDTDIPIYIKNEDDGNT
ncbi:MAG: ATP-binding protein, partial [Clostridiales bacterium]|nr:ATP-binding protein [Clostridiales bacterium]